MSALPANVTWLPTARTKPVQQQPRRGRFPKTIGQIWKVRDKKLMKEYEEKLRQAEIERLDRQWTMTLGQMTSIELALKELGAMPTLLRMKYIT